MGSISRADVAAVCVEALTNPAAKVRPVNASVTQDPLAVRPPLLQWLQQESSTLCAAPKLRLPPYSTLRHTGLYSVVCQQRS